MKLFLEFQAMLVEENWSL